MRQRLFLLLVVVAPASAAVAGEALPGCGTVVVATPDGGSGGRASTASAGGSGGSGGTPAASASSGYVDPGCPDAGAPGMMFMCDPFAQDCPSGEGCYIFTQNPTTPCGQEVYGADCEAAGTGMQGSPCDSAMCAPGFTCVVSGSGDQCVELCQLEGSMSCPDGLVCQPIDVEGFGGCL